MLTTITAPSVLPVSLEDAKAHSRVDHDDEDTLIESLIETATAYLDGEMGLLGRALITQTWELTFDAFPAEIPLPFPPTQAVESITYLDPSGVSQTMDTNEYRLIGRDPGKVIAVNAWPTTKVDPEAVNVRFRAGYGDTAASVPQPLRLAILQHIELLFDVRSLAGNAGRIVPMGYADLISPYRLRGFG